MASAATKRELDRKKIAFIGVGAMGKLIAERLLAGGYDLTVFDVNRDSMASSIDMSTIDPITTRRVGARLAEAGVEMIDCPVGRTTKHARDGKRVLMIGGEPADIDARPCYLIGSRVFSFGVRVATRIGFCTV